MAKDIAKTDIYQSAMTMIAEESMEHMSELEFETLAKTAETAHCKHKKVVKLYYAGMHSNYGCVKCKMKSLNTMDFIQNQQA